MHRHPNNLPPNGPNESAMTQQIHRDQFLTILRLANTAGEHRFARQTALRWLAIYPGDLAVGLAYARALVANEAAAANHNEKRRAEAKSILNGLCMADPENAAALNLWLELEKQSFQDQTYAPHQPEPLANLVNWSTALQGTARDHPPAGNPDSKSAPSWGEQLFYFRKSLEIGRLAEAEQQLPALIGQDIQSPLLAVAHLKLLQTDHQTPLAARRSLADFYHRRWPACLPCTILLASWLMQEGVIERAVSLLHQAAARDVSGDIVRRFLGEDHPYQSLWPDDLSIPFDFSLPASVAAGLGWNQLGTGEITPIADAGFSPASPPIPEPIAAAAQSSRQAEPAVPEAVERAAIASIAISNAREQPTIIDEEILNFRAQQDRISKDLNQQPVSQFDGRYPVYVVFSVHSKLESRYGSQGAAQVEQAMRELAQIVSTGADSERTPEGKSAARKTPPDNIPHKPSKWGSMVFLPDLANSAPTLGLNPLTTVDPWTLKLSLADLDRALGKQGQMIGALLIVGGPEIVPFHNLPNPVDDPDREVPSDNPYASLDENYFIPEWPVGRLPGGSGNDPTYLVRGLQRIREKHASQAKVRPQPKQWPDWIIRWRRRRSTSNNNSSIRKGVGLTAAVWREASFQVFRPVGEAKMVMVSPPTSKINQDASRLRLGALIRSRNGRTASRSDSMQLPPARLNYFNLHGLADASEWYGQRDPEDTGDGPDYPVALTPADVRRLGEKTPQVVFSEACYGAYIEDKNAAESLSLQFLDAGTQVVAGSTTMSYGAINAPLIAADLLGYSFWKGLLEGLTAGESLQRAKIQLASEMHQRQGFLDGEDQKTLISFVLYGDPLSRLTEDVRNAKRLSKEFLRRPQFRRLANRPQPFKIVCDRSSEPGQSEETPPDILAYAKSIVSHYLPGMSDAHATYTAERTICLAHGHACPTGQLYRAHAMPNIRHSSSHAPSDSQPAPKLTDRHVVVLSKTFVKGGHSHPQFVRLTLNAHGKLVKIVVSR